MDWQFLCTLHPTIPVIHAISEHIENEFGTAWLKYKKHTDSPDSGGIQRLVAAYLAQPGVFSQKPGQQLKQGNTFSDHTVEGMRKLGKTIERWVYNRTFVRSTTERFDLLDRQCNVPMEVDTE